MQDLVSVMKTQAVSIAHCLFERGKVTGSTGNISFRAGDVVYVSSSGGSFGFIGPDDFVALDLQGRAAGAAGGKPSKEWPLHLAVYAEHPDVMAVLHTHSFYSTLWSCLPHADEKDCIPRYTPYLQMKLGKVSLVPYAPPGSEALFAAFQERVHDGKGWLLKNHGPVVAGKTLFDAFYGLEELEESARLAWELRNEASAIRIE